MPTDVTDLHSDVIGHQSFFQGMAVGEVIEVRQLLGSVEIQMRVGPGACRLVIAKILI